MTADGPAVDLAAVAGGLGQLLHRAGLPVTPERSGRFAAAVRAATPADVDALYWLARVTLVTDLAELPTFDAVFGQVFRGYVDVADSRGDTAQVAPGRAPTPPARTSEGAARSTADGSRGAGVVAADDADAGRDDDEGEPGQALQATAASQERLQGRDFATMTPAERDALRDLVAALSVAPPLRPGRRHVRHPVGARLDVRATLRHARRTGGDPVRLERRRRRDRPRRLVLIADVSGSMEPYARPYLHLLHGAVRATRAEAFVFSTRLTRLTRALATHDPDLALARAAAAAPDWSGGTRIGHALKSFNDEHGRRGMARGAVVVVVSDGWESEDPALVGEQVQRLSRLAARIVWVNPRKASPRYEPLAGGMAAALPYVDAFVSGHSLAAMDEVVAAIARPVGGARGARGARGSR
jgi:uncharacterized protein with von Willebrand factor type A (vWA) domain